MLAGPANPFRLLASASRRAVHTTSRVRQSNTNEVTSDWLARLTSQPAATPQDKNEAARGMIGSVGMRDMTVDDGRKEFRANKITPPHTYTPDVLFGPKRPNPRPSQMGPGARVAKRIDPFLLRGVNPLDHVANPLMSYAFINNLGKVRPRAETGLSRKSQRRVGKMVRRARAMGIIPRWSSIPRVGGLGHRDWDV